MPRGVTVWLTGLPSAGKTTTGDAVAAALRERGFACYRLDGDVLRATISSDLGFDAASRDENVRRAGHLALLLADAGLLVVASIISPYATGRRAARQLHDASGIDFLEVYLDTPLDVCERRDRRGLYARARRGELTLVTGIDDPYEPPASPDLVVHPSQDEASAVARRVLDAVLARDLSGVLRLDAGTSDEPRG